MQAQRVAVLGCGPSGMAIALLLHRAGHHVEIFERFDVVRPLGSGLLIQPSGQSVFAALGLLDSLRSQSSAVSRLSGISVRSGKRALDVDYGDLPGQQLALGVHRAVLFNLLYSAVLGADIPVFTGRELASGSVSNNDSKKITISFRSKVRQFDLAVDAMGARSPLSSGKIKPLNFGAFWATVDTPLGSSIAKNCLDQRYFAGSRMAGVMPIGFSPFTGEPASAVFWSARSQDVNAILTGGVGQWRADFKSLWPEAEPFVQSIESFEQLSFAQYHHRSGRFVTDERLFHIGDSWHSTSPQLGQGANMALIDAAALARAINSSSRASDIAPAFASMRRRHVHLYQVLSRFFTPLYQSDGKIGPWLRDQIVHRTGRVRMIKRLVARVVSGEFGNGFDPGSGSI